MDRLRLTRTWLSDRRDTIALLLIAVAFGWLGKQQLENHSTAKLAHRTATEAKGTADEAKALALVTQRDTERLGDLSVEAAQAYCKLKLYDELSGTTSSHLFARLGVLPPVVARGVRDALKLVESIKSPRVCDTTTSVPTSSGEHRRSRASGITSTAIERQLIRIERLPAPERARERPPTARLNPPRPKPTPWPVLRPQKPPERPQPSPAPPPILPLRPGPDPHPPPPRPHIEVEVEVPGLAKACVGGDASEHNPHCQGGVVTLG